MFPSRSSSHRSDTSIANGTIRSPTPFGVGWAGGSSKLRMMFRQFFQIAKFLRDAWGIEPRTCSVCGFKGRFYAYGTPPRYDAVCPSCSCLERHRQLALWLARNANRWQGNSVLHFAPDPVIRSIVEPLSSTYIGADIVGAPNCRQLNIEQIELADKSVDLLICSHVLEHVDDKKAMAEMHRVLRSGGLALVMVPMVDAWRKTYENPDVVTARDRFLHFCQDDHIRYYGSDIVARLKIADFTVETFVAEEPDVLEYGLMRGETLFVCTA